MNQGIGERAQRAGHRRHRRDRARPSCISLATTSGSSRSIRVEQQPRSRVTRVPRRSGCVTNWRDSAALMSSICGMVRRTSLIWRLSCAVRGGDGRPLMYNGHTDTVQVSPEQRAEWLGGDPWSGHIADGKLYGRGATDMKGGNAAFAWAVRCLRGGRVPTRRRSHRDLQHWRRDRRGRDRSA